MNKLLLQGAISLALFLTIWFALYQVNWLEMFEVERAANTTEEKLGELCWELFAATDDVVKDKKVIKSIDTLVEHICKANDLDYSKIKLHVVEKSDINAMALPDGHLVVFTGLVTACKSQAELSGVLGHELAHIQKNHVMKKLAKEIGFSVLVTITTGNGNTQIAKKALQHLTSSAYDRSLEEEADRTSVDYLLEAKINPQPFADFLYRISISQGEVTKQLAWVSTHPDSEERAKTIMDYTKNKKIEDKPVLSEDQWDTLKKKVGEAEGE